jgi:hypothetical protein
VLISFIYIFWGIGLLLNRKKFFCGMYLMKKAGWIRWSVAVLTFVGIKFLLKTLSNDVVRMPLSYILHGITVTSILQPAGFLVAHITYFGPMIILLVMLWLPITRMIQSYGIGLVLCVALMVVFSICSESRRSINFYPFVVPFLAAVIDQLKWKKIHYAVLTLLSAVFSKVWMLTYHARPWRGDAFQFPNQLFYMNYGPWMSHQMYVLQGSIILVCAIGLYFGMVRGK